MRRTDTLPILYPRGTSTADRRFCRDVITTVRAVLSSYTIVIVACSGGIDSTVLAHAVSQGLRIQPLNIRRGRINSTAVYINHNLRSSQVAAEAEHVEQLARSLLTFHLPSVELQIGYGPGIQERAREARYTALAALASDLQRSIEIPYPWKPDVIIQPMVAVLTGHNKNDNVETKLMNFLKGRSADGIPQWRSLGDRIDVRRPLLEFSRQDIERYARCFHLKWMEDSSNDEDVYTRNKVRHHLIPWIESNINPGLLDTLGSISYGE